MIESLPIPSFLAATLRISTPLLYASLGALISDRAGVINIGLEGIMLWAAFTGATTGALTQNVLLGIVAGLFAAIIAALVLALFHLRFDGDLVLGGIAINILGSAGTVALGERIADLRGGSLSQLTAVTAPTVSLPFLRDIPLIGEALFVTLGGQNILTWLSLVTVALVALVLYRTPFGIHLRAVGEAPEAAASVGINVKRIRYSALALSGFLAGLGGIHLSMAYISGFTRDMTGGRGYIALVVPALGGGTPQGTLFAVLLWGAFAALETRLGSAAIPSQFPLMIPYLATLAALVIYAVRRRARLGLQRQVRRL